jgi:lipid-A-disaccharide synthase
MKIFISAGEPSGDFHAANLVRNLRSATTMDLSFFGLGGEKSKNAGVEIISDISQLALVGVVEVIRNIFTVGKAYKSVVASIDAEKPDLAILVDYPGFNLRLAAEFKKRNVPVVYYISPQIWAWGMNRIKIIKRCVRKVIVFFAFEEKLYKSYGVDAEFVGHPLLDTVRASMSTEEARTAYGLSKEKKTLALLPGSRAIEVSSLLKTMVSSAQILDKRLNGVQVIVARYGGIPLSIYEEAVKGSGLDVKIVTGDTYNALKASDFAIVASGTATLETAIIGTPFVIAYKVNPLTFLIGKLMAKVRFLGLVNILAGREVAPEFLQMDATPHKIAAKACEIMSDDKKMALMKVDLKAVVASLGQPGAGLRAALAILPLL